MEYLLQKKRELQSYGGKVNFPTCKPSQSIIYNDFSDC